MRDLLRLIGQQLFARRFYLAGGTALALRFGHRRSVDLDFFSEADELEQATRNEVLRALAPVHPQSIEDTTGNLLLQALGLHVGFFSYHYALLEPADQVENVVVASMVDIGLMKFDALISRGSRKDFYDLYFIAQQISLADLLERGPIKYPHTRDFELMAIESMVLFENADQDLQPALFIDLPWDQVRQFFISQAQSLGEKWFGEENDYV